MTTTAENPWDIELEINEFEIKIDTKNEYGYFEWVGGTNLDEECGGGLWFDNNTVVDYDGVSELPDSVILGLVQLGFNVEEVT